MTIGKKDGKLNEKTKPEKYPYSNLSVPLLPIFGPRSRSSSRFQKSFKKKFYPET